MLVEDLLGKHSEVGTRELTVIKKSCAQFLKESAGLPLYKLLPSSYGNFHRVKVRQQKRNNTIAEAFNRAFGKDFYNLHQRSIFTYAAAPTDIAEGTEPFYVFPTDGYKFLYSKEVTNSTNDYKTVMNTLIEQFDNDKAVELITDVLKYTYVSDNLVEGIISDSEIIFYGVPSFYAIRVSAHPAYGTLFQR